MLYVGAVGCAVLGLLQFGAYRDWNGLCTWPFVRSGEKLLQLLGACCYGVLSAICVIGIVAGGG